MRSFRKSPSMMKVNALPLEAGCIQTTATPAFSGSKPSATRASCAISVISAIQARRTRGFDPPRIPVCRAPEAIAAHVLGLSLEHPKRLP
ncbi:unnamed protein product [Symbiodinium natans]|uniref:Uncharacterized protein n=1 Tax=Symbiodinium natans TaxID=878477 RepID=A0A812M4E0_9DINO|nr:unnamed protein product [Symbiodinium natans]